MTQSIQHSSGAFLRTALMATKLANRKIINQVTQPDQFKHWVSMLITLQPDPFATLFQQLNVATIMCEQHIGKSQQPDRLVVYLLDNHDKIYSVCQLEAHYDNALH